LSAARYPIVVYGSVHRPFIRPHTATLDAVLRKAHTRRMVPRNVHAVTSGERSNAAMRG
jgi:hypothetical protein